MSEHFWLSVGFVGQAFFSMRQLTSLDATRRDRCRRPHKVSALGDLLEDVPAHTQRPLPEVLPARAYRLSNGVPTIGIAP